MDKTTLVRNAIAATWLSLLIPALAATNPAPHVYASDLGLAVRIGNELYQTLDEKFQRKISPEAIAVEQTDAPEIMPITRNAESKTPCQVMISTGYVNLINHLAHAKAIDRIQPGYFRQYVSDLGRQTTGEKPPEPPDMIEARYWSDAVMNDQASYFNQMMGITLAINLSHHYLGHCQEYAGEMQAGKPAPINNFITPAEWDASVKAATLNSLDCAIGPAGAEALFAAIDQMPQRPAWTGYIVPLNVNIKKLNLQLASYEAAYFHGGLKLKKSIANWTGAATRLAAK
jgi:hypothetical protein